VYELACWFYCLLWIFSRMLGLRGLLNVLCILTFSVQLTFLIALIKEIAIFYCCFASVCKLMRHFAVNSVVYLSFLIKLFIHY
jgi:hypothetical protein